MPWDEGPLVCAVCSYRWHGVWPCEPDPLGECPPATGLECPACGARAGQEAEKEDDREAE